MVPINVPSHVGMNILVGHLLTTKGHKVTLVLPEGYHVEDERKLSQLTVERYKLEGGIDIRDKEWSEEGLKVALNGSTWDIIKYTSAQIDGFKATFESVLKDKQFLAKISKGKYDIALVDMVSTIGLLPYKLNIPFSVIGYNCYQARWPNIYSYIPFITTTFTDRMTFWQRVQNFLLFWTTEMSFMLDLDDIISVSQKYIPERKPLTLAEINTQPEACLILREHVTDFPRPLPSHAFYIGSILGRPAEPLKEKSLRSFVEKAADGVIIVTFGTWLDKLPLNILKVFMDAFRGIKQRVVMRYKGSDTLDIPPNVKLVSWMPQNDLLGHNKTRLVIYHGGANSMQEVAYHGVPSITIPLLLDQGHNGAIVKSKNYGEMFDIRELTSTKLKRTINQVLANQELNKNCQKVKQIMQNKHKSGLDTLDYWINYVIQFGGGFLKSKAQYEMPSYAYYCEDVKVFLFSIAALVLYTLYKILHVTCSCCFCKQSKKKQD